MKINKKVYYTIKIVIGLFAIFFIWQLIPYFTFILQMIIQFLEITEQTNEIKFLYLCVSVYITLSMINTITNIIFKLQKMLKYEYVVQEEYEKSRK